MPGPASLELIAYDAVASILGQGSSAAVYICDIADTSVAEAWLLRRADPMTAGLTVVEVAPTLYKGDPLGKMQLTAKGLPTWKVAKLLPGQPFEVFYTDAAETITTDGSYHWQSDNAAVGTDVKPWIRCTRIDCRIVGSVLESKFNSYAPLIDTVNSDVINGAAVGTLLFKGWTSAPRMDDAGNRMRDVELIVSWRKQPWNQMWRPDITDFDTMLDDATSEPDYPSAAWLGLLPQINW